VVPQEFAIGKQFLFLIRHCPFVTHIVKSDIRLVGYKGENIYAKRKTSIAILEMTAWVNQFVMTTEEFL
jgi:phage replication-related protein YjqB (UPF0714/DUF867 family)